MPAIKAAIVILGASGDLAKRKLIPALSQLVKRGDVSTESVVIGSGRSTFTDADFRNRFDICCEFEKMLFYHQGIPGLKKAISEKFVQFCQSRGCILANPWPMVQLVNDKWLFHQFLERQKLAEIPALEASAQNWDTLKSWFLNYKKLYLKVSDLEGNQFDTVLNVVEQSYDPPVASEIEAQVANNLLEVSWISDLPGNSQLRWGKSEDNLSHIFEKNRNTKMHSIYLPLSAVEPKIYFQVKSCFGDRCDGWSEIYQYPPDNIGTDSTDKLSNQSVSRLNCFPNPFTEKICLNFYLLSDDFVRINIYNTYGRKIKTLFEGNLNQGIQQIFWDGTASSRLNGKKVSTGCYLIEILTEDSREIRKVSYIK